MRSRKVAGAFAVVMLAVSVVTADEALKSGPQVGKSPGAFNPLHVTGPNAGKKLCLVWTNGGNPVAMVFARGTSDSLTSLVKKLDAATAKNADKKMGSFVVFLTDDENLGDKLKALAEKNKFSQCILSTDNVAGPPGYKIAKEAEVTVILYNNRKVEVNSAFKKGELDAKAVEKIVSQLPKILE